MFVGQSTSLPARRGIRYPTERRPSAVTVHARAQYIYHVHRHQSNEYIYSLQGRLTPHHGWEINPPPPHLTRWSTLHLFLAEHEAVASFQREPQPKSNLVYFGLKIWHLVATILMISGHITVKMYMKKMNRKTLGSRDPQPPTPPKWRPWHEGTILLFGAVWFGCESLEAAP